MDHPAFTPPVTAAVAGGLGQLGALMNPVRIRNSFRVLDSTTAGNFRGRERVESLY
jgi:hypothetical protein